MATLKDVAQRCGVSLSTVSIVARGLGDARKISQSTQEKVRAAMREVGYVPSAAARSLRGGASRQILALYWADGQGESALARLLAGLHAAIEKRRLDWDIAVVPYRAGGLAEVPSLAGASNFNLAIVANPDAPDLEFLAAKPPVMPVVLYGARLDGMPSVAVDEAEVGRLAAELIGDAAEARGAFSGETGEALCLCAPFSAAQTREQAFIDGLAEKGIRCRRATVAEQNASAGFDAVLSLGALGGLTSVFAPNENVALGVLHALRSRGIDVPGRVGVVAVASGPRDCAEHAFPPLTCVELPVEQMALDCVDLLRAGLTAEKRADPKLARRASL